MSSSPPDVLVVLGATGNQGAAVLKYFAKTPTPFNFTLRGLTRDTTSNASKELQNLGIEMVQADLNDPKSLQSAFKGATHIFANTDSNRLIHNAIKDPSLLLAGYDSPRAWAASIELAQGQNIAAAAAAVPTLKRLVWSSLPSPRKLSKGKYTKVTMFDTKDDILVLLNATPGLEDKISTVLVGFYANNALGAGAGSAYGLKKRGDGRWEMSLPMSGDVPVPVADLEVDLGVWTKVLFEMEAGTVLVGSTELISWKGWLALWAERNGVEAEFVQADDKEYVSRLPGVHDALLQEFKFMEEFGFDGGMEGVVWPDELRQRGVQLQQSTIDDHIKRTDWSGML